VRLAFSPPKPPKRNNRHITVFIVLLMVALAALVAIPVIKARGARPVIESIEPSIGDPGGILTIHGKNFGLERDEGKVEFDGISSTASSYLLWSEKLVRLRIPLYAESSLVRIITEDGRSNAKMFMSSALLPSAPAGSGSQALGPTIESLSSEAGVIGAVLLIRGLNFGANRADSTVLFTWTGESGIQVPADESGRGYVSPRSEFGEYESWSDKEIRVRVPDGAVTGGIAVRTVRGTSQVKYFQVVDSPGVKSYLGRKTYALSTFVTISRVRTSGLNSLYLWMPFPSDTPSQRGVKALNRSMEPLFPDYRGLSAYHLVDLQADQLVTVSQDHLVQVYGVEIEIKADKIQASPTPASSVYTTFTQADQLVPSADPAILAFAKKAAGKEKNHYRIARSILDALVGAVRFDAQSSAKSPVEALASASADSWDLSILYAALLRAGGVPALPVAGVIVDDSRRAWRHAWVEFYVYGFGWIPVDPSLFAGAEIGAFITPFDNPVSYFGNMDNRHIAFSRGLTNVDRMAPDGRTVAASRRYSFQSIFEEAGGDLPAYTSFWSDVEITGVY